MLESQSSRKRLKFEPSCHWKLENLPCLWHHSQKIQNQKFFFHCRLEELLSLLRVWTALYAVHCCNAVAARDFPCCLAPLCWLTILSSHTVGMKTMSCDMPKSKELWYNTKGNVAYRCFEVWYLFKLGIMHSEILHVALYSLVSLCLAHFFHKLHFQWGPF